MYNTYELGIVVTVNVTQVYEKKTINCMTKRKAKAISGDDLNAEDVSEPQNSKKMNLSVDNSSSFPKVIIEHCKSWYLFVNIITST